MSTLTESIKLHPIFAAIDAADVNLAASIAQEILGSGAVQHLMSQSHAFGADAEFLAEHEHDLADSEFTIGERYMRAANICKATA